jgi:hypothetical protein
MIWLHVSELSIDRLLAGEVATADAEAMRDHARACKACGDRLAAAQTTQRECVGTLPRLPITVARPRTSRIATIGAAVTALAAVFALVVGWPRAHTGRGAHVIEPAERTKGRALAGFFVAHAGDIRRGSVHETVSPGDRLQLFTTSTTPAWFAVISVDARGTRSVYIEPRVIEPGTERLLPLSLELDDSLGGETLTAIFCAERFDPETVDLTRCTTDTFTLTKVAR